MKCARCNTTLDDAALVCGQCGAVVGAHYGPPGGKRPFVSRPPSFPAAQTAQTPRLVARVKSLLRSPRKEWPVIAAEPSTAMEIYTAYALPLAAVGALALSIAVVTIGVPVAFLGMVKATIVTGIAAGLVLLALALAHLFALALIVNALARRFGGEPDRLSALKVAAYSYTPIWLAGVLFLIPGLSVLWFLAALYALYLAFVGLPTVMRCHSERAASYALVAGVCAFALSVFFAALLTTLTGFGPDIFD